MQGVKNIKKTNLNSHFLFIAPPSVESLEARLKARGTETPQTLADRLAAAKAELEYSKTGAHDLVLVNDNVEEAYKKLKAFVTERYTITGSKP
jgi:guanylate kinase